MWFPKFLFIEMSTTNWYRVNFNFTALPLLALIGIIIWAVNKLLRFIFTTSFGDEYNFLNFYCEDPFIVLLNVSWRSKWFSKIFWSSKCCFDIRSWRRASCYTSLIIDILKVCWSSFEFLQLVLRIKDLSLS